MRAKNYRFHVPGLRYGLCLGALCFSNPALACDLTALPFDESPAALEKTLGEPLQVHGQKGTMLADMRASDICKDLPPTAIATFTFLDGAFTRLDILSKHGKGEVLALVEKQFGKADRRPPTDHPRHNDFHQIWLNEGKPLATYLSASRGEYVQEQLQISSRKHADKQAEISKQEEGGK